MRNKPLMVSFRLFLKKLCFEAWPPSAYSGNARPIYIGVNPLPTKANIALATRHTTANHGPGISKVQGMDRVVELTILIFALFGKKALPSFVLQPK